MKAETDGRFVWTELLTMDPEAAKSFYRQVVGWDTAGVEGGDPTYTMFTAGGRPVGGVTDLPDAAKAAGAPPHWLSYIGTEDVDSTAERAQELGAEVLVAPQSIPSLGRFAVLRDPQGAIFAIYASDGASPGTLEPSLGDFTWYELATTDREAALNFYRSLFGWEPLDAVDMGPAGIYQLFGLDGTMIGGIYEKAPDQPGPPAWLAYANVIDLEAALAKARRAGAMVMVEPMEVPGGDRIAIATDPEGVMFALHERGPASEA